MHNLIMGSLDGKSESLAFEVGLLEKVIEKENTRLLSLPENSGVLVEVDGRKYPVENMTKLNGTKPYFLLLKNGARE